MREGWCKKELLDFVDDEKSAHFIHCWPRRQSSWPLKWINKREFMEIFRAKIKQEKLLFKKIATRMKGEKRKESRQSKKKLLNINHYYFKCNFYCNKTFNNWNVFFAFKHLLVWHEHTCTLPICVRQGLHALVLLELMPTGRETVLLCPYFQ